MAENEDRKPFMSFSFNEEGTFDRYAGIYLHVPLKKPPTGEEIAIMVGTIKTFAETWRKISERLKEAPPLESAQPLPDEPDTALPLGPRGDWETQGERPPGRGTESPREEAAQPGGRPPGGATDAQCKKILAISHRLDDNTVIKAIEGYAGVEWRLDRDGHCLPNWDFLRSLTIQKASNIIERLERAEA